MSSEAVVQARLIAELEPMESPIAAGTGALPLRKDLRLRGLASASDVRRKLIVGVPEKADLSSHVKGAYWQNDENSCAAYSTAAMQSIFEHIEQGKWLTLNAEEAYQAVGGYGPNGVDSRDVLEWVRTVGMQGPATSTRYKIESYAFVYPLDADGILTIKAAVALDRPCVLAFYPPADFGQQWTSQGGDGNCQSDVPVCCLHQICIIGYDAERFYLLNSYSDQWGTKGMGSIAWSFLRHASEQSYAYAYSAVDAHDPGLTALFSKQQIEYFRAHPKKSAPPEPVTVQKPSRGKPKRT